MEETDSNDSTGPLMARFYAATPVRVSLARVFLEKKKLAMSIFSLHLL